MLWLQGVTPCSIQEKAASPSERVRTKQPEGATHSITCTLGVAPQGRAAALFSCHRGAAWGLLPFLSLPGTHRPRQRLVPVQ